VHGIIESAVIPGADTIEELKLAVEGNWCFANLSRLGGGDMTASYLLERSSV
jgi:hypothetical protein